MVARKAKLAKELEGAGAMALSNELLLLDADRGSQGTELEEDCAPAVEDERRWRDTLGGSRARGRQGRDAVVEVASRGIGRCDSVRVVVRGTERERTRERWRRCGRRWGSRERC